jgi:hypothetical protein
MIENKIIFIIKWELLLNLILIDASATLRHNEFNGNRSTTRLYLCSSLFLFLSSLYALQPAMDFGYSKNSFILLATVLCLLTAVSSGERSFKNLG